MLEHGSLDIQFRARRSGFKNSFPVEVEVEVGVDVRQKLRDSLFENGCRVELMTRVFAVLGGVEGFELLYLLLVKEEGIDERLRAVGRRIQTMPVVAFVVDLPVDGQGEDQLLAAPHPQP